MYPKKCVHCNILQRVKFSKHHLHIESSCPQVFRTYLNLKLSQSSIASISHNYRNFFSSRDVPELAFASRHRKACFSNSSSLFGDIVPFKLTDIGEGIKEVELLQWFVQPGDEVRQFDKVCEVQSDKATVEITSRYDGIVMSLHHDIGSMIPTGAALVDISLPSRESASTPLLSNSLPNSDVALSLSSTQPPPTEPIIKINGKSTLVLATPAVRRIAREFGVDLIKEGSYISATGPQNRILKEDIEKYVQKKKLDAMQTDTGPLSSEFVLSANWTSQKDSIPFKKDIKEAYSPLLGEVIPLRGMQRAMAEHMRKALQVPHMGYCEEIDVTELSDLRKNIRNSTMIHTGIDKMSFLPIIIKATSLALAKYPVLNSRMLPCESALQLLVDHNIGIAMDTPRGLVVPNVKKVQEKSILDIARELQRLQDLGQAGKLCEDDLSGGTFTLSNIGAIGGIYTSPVLLVPQVGIGALGRMRYLPRYDSSGNIVKCPMLPISWSADHRVVDGATLSRFSNLWKNFLENPALMLAQTR